MNEKELSRALLEGASYPTIQPPDPKALTRRIIRHDNIRVWLFGYFCLMAWFGVAVGAFTIGMELTHGFIPHLVAKLTKLQFTPNHFISISPASGQGNNESNRAVELPKEKVITIDPEAGKQSAEKVSRQHHDNTLISARDLQMVNSLVRESQPYFFLLIAGESLLLCLAAILSVAYISSGRKATMRHMNASLIEISEQLKRLGTLPGAA
ncbi:MAG TPA: hypothetical protein PLN21_19660 [Gemmatales bacterium]|nr:hypothetical protein [Gemmatales bacterium]